MALGGSILHHKVFSLFIVFFSILKRDLMLISHCRYVRYGKIKLHCSCQPIRNAARAMLEKVIRSPHQTVLVLFSSKVLPGTSIVSFISFSNGEMVALQSSHTR